MSTTSQNALIFGMNHPLGEGIHVCSNEVPRGLNVYIHVVMYSEIIFSRTAAPNGTIIFSMDHL